jgi:hypothetical protein
MPGRTGPRLFVPVYMGCRTVGKCFEQRKLARAKKHRYIRDTHAHTQEAQEQLKRLSLSDSRPDADEAVARSSSSPSAHGAAQRMKEEKSEGVGREGVGLMVKTLSRGRSGARGWDEGGEAEAQKLVDHFSRRCDASAEGIILQCRQVLEGQTPNHFRPSLIPLGRCCPPSTPMEGQRLLHTHMLAASALACISRQAVHCAIVRVLSALSPSSCAHTGDSAPWRAMAECSCCMRAQVQGFL